MIISIHPPRGGWDPIASSPRFFALYFNPPTPWGVGPGSAILADAFQPISIHPPRGGWDPKCQDRRYRHAISIHPPRGGWDRYGFPGNIQALDFNPPTPWGVGPIRGQRLTSTFPFQSTHPVGGGTEELWWVGDYSDISIHPPRGGWDIGGNLNATLVFISIHPPRGGWDDRLGWTGQRSCYFNPPTPWGVGRLPTDGYQCQ